MRSAGFSCVNDRERAVSQRQFAFLDRLAAVDAERDLSGFAAEVLKIANGKRAGLHIDGNNLHRTALCAVFNDGVGCRYNIAVQNRDRQAGGDADGDGRDRIHNRQHYRNAGLRGFCGKGRN